MAHVEVMEEKSPRDYHVLVDARGAAPAAAGRRPSVEVVLRPDANATSSLLRGEIVMAQEAASTIDDIGDFADFGAAFGDAARPSASGGLVKCLETDFNAAAAKATPAPAIQPSRPVRNHESLIDRTIDLERYASGVRSEISLDHGLTTNHQHPRGWLTSSSRQYQGTFDSEDNSVLFNSPRGVIKLAPFLQAQAHPRSSTPQNVPGSTGMSCGVLSTAFKSSPICASANTAVKARYASAADPHAIKSATSQERTADLSESQTNSELRFVGIAGGLGP